VERAGLSTLNEGAVIEYEIVSNKGKESAEKHQGKAITALDLEFLSPAKTVETGTARTKQSSPIIPLV
jgi:hypothetical protein